MTILFLIVLYFLPTFIGIIRYRLNIWAIILTNLVFGWTLIGWIVALIMSLKSDENDRLKHVIELLEKRKD